ncbi:hypothetical protein V1511DRAFT_499815 [Dipodascopsis uninucleata]
MIPGGNKADVQNARAKLVESYNQILEEFSTDKELKNVGNYSVSHMIGKGSFGKVYLAKHKLTGLKVVLKSADKSDLNLAREIHHYRQLLHPHIARLYEVIITESLVWLALEYCPGDDLYTYVSNKGRLSIDQTQRIFSQLCGAVAYIHAKNIVHRDIKLENILMDKYGRVKLCDFGFTRECEPKRLLQTFCGTICYAAPEMVKGEKYNGQAVDIWSLGVILYGLLCGELPFDEEDEIQTRMRISTDEPPYPDHIPEEALSLLKSVLSKRASDRPSAAEILKHPFLDSYSSAQVSILNLPDPVPFTTKYERDLLNRFRHSHIDIEALKDSVVLNKCDNLAGWWSLALEEFEHSKSKKSKRKQLTDRYKRQTEAPNTPAYAAASMLSQNITGTTTSKRNSDGSLPGTSPQHNVPQVDSISHLAHSCNGLSTPALSSKFITFNAATSSSVAVNAQYGETSSPNQSTVFSKRDRRGFPGFTTMMMSVKNWAHYNKNPRIKKESHSFKSFLFSYGLSPGKHRQNTKKDPMGSVESGFKETQDKVAGAKERTQMDTASNDDVQAVANKMVTIKSHLKEEQDVSSEDLARLNSRRRLPASVRLDIPTMTAYSSDLSLRSTSRERNSSLSSRRSSSRRNTFSRASSTSSNSISSMNTTTTTRSPRSSSLGLLPSTPTVDSFDNVLRNSGRRVSGGNIDKRRHSFDDDSISISSTSTNATAKSPSLSSSVFDPGSMTSLSSRFRKGEENFSPTDSIGYNSHIQKVPFKTTRRSGFNGDAVFWSPGVSSNNYRANFGRRKRGATKGIRGRQMPTSLADGSASPLSGSGSEGGSKAERGRNNVNNSRAGKMASSKSVIEEVDEPETVDEEAEFSDDEGGDNQ